MFDSMTVLLAPGILAMAALLWLCSRFEAFVWARLEVLGARLGSRALRYLLPFALFVGIGLLYVERHHPTGDEAEYHLVAESIWEDGDLLVQKANWARERRTAHEPGAALITAPAQAALGRLGVVLVMSAAAALTAAQAWRLGMLAGGCHAAASALAWLAALGPPLMFHSYLFYPEALSAALVALGLRALLDGGLRGAPWLAGAAIAALPWLHVRMNPPAALLVVLFLALRPWRQSVQCLALVGASAVTYLLVRAPARSVLRFFEKPPRGLQESSPYVAFAGQWLDAAHGLLPFAPVFLLALAALAVPRQAGRRRLVPVLVALSVIGPMVFWRGWWGGECAPARYLVPAVSALATLVAVRAAHSPRGLARLGPGLAAYGIALAVAMTLQPGVNGVALDRDAPAPIWSALSQSGAPSIDRYLPLLSLRGDPAPGTTGPPAAEQRVALSLGAALLLLLAADRLALARQALDRGFRTLLLPAALLCVHVLVVELWARAGA
jgi:hypothetical protein